MDAAWGNSPARARDDRTAVLVFVLIDSVCTIAGFVTNSARHIGQFGLDYPLIVHVHAVTFMGWLVLFNTQIWLARVNRADLHRRLGKAMGWLTCWMLVIGPATAIIRDKDLSPPGIPPVFVSVQLTDMIAFGSLTFAALYFRKAAPTHRRLMLLALFYVSDAGFARLVNGILALPLGETPIAQVVGLYGFTNVLALSLGLYDLIRHGRLFPAYLAGLAWIIVLQATALYLLTSPDWSDLVGRMYGI